MFSWFSNLRLRWKVLFAPAFLILVMAGVGAFAIITQRDNQAAVDALMVGPVRQAEVLAEYANQATRTQVQLYHLTATAANETDEKKLKALGAATLKAVNDLAERLKTFEDPAFVFGRTREKIDQLKTAASTYVKQAKNVIDFADGDAATALTYMMSASRTFTAIEKLSDELADISKEIRDNRIAHNNAEVDRKAMLLVTVMLIVIALGCVISFLVARGISKPVVQLAAAIKRMAEGDFDIKLPDLRRKDEIGEIAIAFNTTVERLSDMIRAIADAAREVSNATGEISTSTTDLSQRTEEQAASLEETSASMEEIASIVKNNADNAQHANQSATATRAEADRGGQVIAQAVSAMARIEESSHRISDIIGVIDEIARQTNLLALNAAVEAARAGEAGRGFAVVATEVRSLAQRSSQAAKDIKELITNSNGQVKDGVDLVNKAGAALGEIVASIKKVADVVSDIASASAEQSAGIEQVNKALTQMDEVTQQNSALVEENAATAKMLEELAVSMNERVSFFRLRGQAQEQSKVVHAKPQAKATPEPKETQVAPVTPRRPTSARQAGTPSVRKPVLRTRGATALAAENDADWKDF